MLSRHQKRTEESRVASYHAPQEWKDWSDWLAAGWHERSRWQLALLMMGLVVGSGRRVVASWIRAAGLSDDDQDYILSAAERWPSLARVGTTRVGAA